MLRNYRRRRGFWRTVRSKRFRPLIRILVWALAALIAGDAILIGCPLYDACLDLLYSSSLR
jgi:hypothetical protein